VPWRVDHSLLFLLSFFSFFFLSLSFPILNIEGSGYSRVFDIPVYTKTFFFLFPISTLVSRSGFDVNVKTHFEHHPEGKFSQLMILLVLFSKVLSFSTFSIYLFP